MFTRALVVLLFLIPVLEQTRGPRRCFHFWDDQDGQVQLEIAAIRESGEIGDGDEVRIFSWMPAAPASGAPDDLRAHKIAPERTSFWKLDAFRALNPRRLQLLKFSAQR